MSNSAATIAKSLQSCPTPCDPIDGSPPGSPVPGFSRQEHWSGLPTVLFHKQRGGPLTSLPLGHSAQIAAGFPTFFLQPRLGNIFRLAARAYVHVHTYICIFIFIRYLLGI